MRGLHTPQLYIVSPINTSPAQDYDEAKEKKIQMDEFRVEVYKTLEITDLLELQGGPRNH